MSARRGVAAFAGHGAPVHTFAEVSSTNDVAKELASRGAKHGTVVLADSQLAGRGRRDHQWHSPEGGNLYMSVVLRPRWPVGVVPQLTLLAGVAVAEGTAEVYGVSVALKWPNDLLWGRQKVGGVLCEASLQGSALEHVVVGVGVNLVGGQDGFPAELRTIATTLEACGGGAVIGARDMLGAACAQRLTRWAEGEAASTLASVRARWGRWAALPAPVVLSDGRHGEAVGIEERGGLEVLCGNERVVINSGVVHWG